MENIIKTGKELVAGDDSKMKQDLLRPINSIKFKQ